MRAKKGFTLVELLVVMAIIAILAAVAVPIVIQYIDKTEVKSDKVYFDNTVHNVEVSVSEIFKNSPSVSIDQVLTRVYTSNNGLYNPTSPAASDKGNFPYLIVPKGTAGMTGKYITVELYENPADANDCGYEVIMYDGSSTTASRKVRVPELVIA